MKGGAGVELIQSVTQAIRYMESNLTNDISIEDAANQALMSSSHFQRVFNVVTGITVGEYIRNRRLSLAGLDLLLENSRVIDIAMRYQYDTSESFSKAFARFHGIPPSAAREKGDQLKCFDPITISILIQGGFSMSRKIMRNDQGVRLIREKFEYRHIGQLRFIGVDLTKNPGLSYREAVAKIAPLLDPLMEEYASEITDWCFLVHYQNQFVNEDYHMDVIGRFFKAGAPVPQEFVNATGMKGLYYYDIPTKNMAYGVYSGDESFGGDPFDAYLFTQEQILSDGVKIPFPENFWHGWQYIEGEPRKGKYRFAYMFGIGDIDKAKSKKIMLK
jgi:AraC-like DNA-binding protein